MPDYIHDEEEFTTGFNGRTVLRMFGEVKPVLAARARLLLPHRRWSRWATAFLRSSTSGSSTRRSWRTTRRAWCTIAHALRRHHPRAGLCGVRHGVLCRHPRRARAVRSAQEDVQPPPGALLLLLRPHAGGMDHGAGHLGLWPHLRPHHLGPHRRVLGAHEHHLLHGLHVPHRLEAGGDHLRHHPLPRRRGGAVQEPHRGGVPQGEEAQLEDHRRLQRKHHRACAW